MRLKTRLKEEMESQVLLEELTFGESGDALRNHYKMHVLQPGETFDPSNPKFDYMPRSEYIIKCNELVQKKCSTNFDDDVFGWVQWRPGDRDYTIVKFEKLPNGQYQEVVYQAFGTDIRYAYTFMLYRGGLQRIKRVYNRLKDSGVFISDMNNQSNFTINELENFDKQLNS